MLEEEAETINEELVLAISNLDQAKVCIIEALLIWKDNYEGIQSQMKILQEEKDRMRRESLSLQKQLDYYRVCLFLKQSWY